MSGYDIGDHGKMLADSRRVGAYASALQATIRPGDTVLDIGSGTGIFALIALRFGAEHVIAVEPGEVIELARTIARTNGCASRITFVQDVSTNVVLERPADVIVADLHGVLPFLETGIASVIDARTRLLVPGGKLIPQLDRVWMALVGVSDIYADLVDVWDTDYLGFDLTAGRRFVTNSFRRLRTSQLAFISEPRCWATLDYRRIMTPNAHGSGTWRVDSPSTAHGLALWFDSELAAGIGFSNAPGEPELVFGRAFLPFASPLELPAGATVVARVAADLFQNDYVFRWDVEITAADGDIIARLSQSTFDAVPVSPTKLRRAAAVHRPSLSEGGLIDVFVLGLMDSNTSLDEIATLLRQRFPERFTDDDQALARVALLSQKYSS